MEIEYLKDSIILRNKSLSDVDKFVLEFVDIIKIILGVSKKNEIIPNIELKIIK
ncbi:MAG TPA: hypothetical protein PKH80_09355 [Methanofastidiosum sp.]|nr:hypothetical protein [Methanofastidiosum sp.]